MQQLENTESMEKKTGAQELSLGQRKKKLAFGKLARILGRGLISIAPMLGLKGWPGALASFLGAMASLATKRRKRVGAPRSFLPRDRLQDPGPE